MVTVNAAAATASDDVIGVLAPGRVADIVIFDGAVHTGFRAVLDAEPEDVTLVMRAGKALYGDDALVGALFGGDCDPLDVCGTPKRVCAAGEIGMTLAELQAAAGTVYGAFFCGTPDDEPTCVPSRPAAVNG